MITHIIAIAIIILYLAFLGLLVIYKRKLEVDTYYRLEKLCEDLIVVEARLSLLANEDIRPMSPSDRAAVICEAKGAMHSVSIQISKIQKDLTK